MVMSYSFLVVSFFASCIPCVIRHLVRVGSTPVLYSGDFMCKSQQTSCVGFPKSLQAHARILPQIKHSSLFPYPVIIIQPLNAI